MITGFVFSQVTLSAGINQYRFMALNYYSFENNEKAIRNIATQTDFYLGFQQNVRFSSFYALQPELNYSRQGALLRFRDGKEEFVRLSYLGFNIVNKFYVNKLNIHIAPTLDFLFEQKAF